MKNKIVLKFVALTYIIAWVCWFGLMILVDHHIVTYGDGLFMSLYLLGGICPSIAGIIALRKDKTATTVLRSESLKYKVNIVWYVGIVSAPLLLSGFSWLLNIWIVGKGGPFLTGSIWTVIPMLPVMIIGGGSEEIGWRGVMLSKLLEEMSVLKATLLISIVWALWHIPLWFIHGVPQYGTNFILFVCGTFSLSFLLSIIYVRTRSVLICILFHAIENAYLNVGLDSWSHGITSSLLIAMVSLIFPIILFYIFILSGTKARVHL
jgi:uncharacterized protein